MAVDGYDVGYGGPDGDAVVLAKPTQSNLGVVEFNAFCDIARATDTADIF